MRGRPCGFSAATGRCPVSKGRVRGPLLRTCEGDRRFARGFPGERSDGPQVGSGSARQAAPVFVSDRKKRNFSPVRGMGAPSARSGCSASPVAIVPAVVSGAAARTQPRLRHSLVSGTASPPAPARRRRRLPPSCSSRIRSGRSGAERSATCRGCGCRMGRSGGRCRCRTGATGASGPMRTEPGRRRSVWRGIRPPVRERAAVCVGYPRVGDGGAPFA